MSDKVPVHKRTTKQYMFVDFSTKTAKFFSIDFFTKSTFVDKSFLYHTLFQL